MPFRAFLNAPQRQAKALQTGGWLFCLWMVLLGVGVSAQMLYFGASSHVVLVLHMLAPLVACAALWLGQRGYWPPVAVGLIVFVMGIMFVMDHGNSEFVVASLMNIAVLTLFAAWMLGTTATVLVALVSQVQLVMLVMQGAYRWSALWPMMVTCLFLGGIAIYARRLYDRHTHQLKQAGEEIQAYQAHNRLLASVVEQSPYSVEIINYDGKIVYANSTYLSHMGYEESEVLGQRAREVSMNGLDEETYQSMRQMIRSGTPWFGVVRNSNKQGDTMVEHVMVAPIENKNGEIDHFVQTKLDISERVYAQERIHQLMNYDKLTQLPNSLALQRKLEELLQQERERLGREPSNHAPHIWHGLLLLNIDRFNQFNTVNGSEWGDKLLIEIAARLQDLQGDNQHMWMARYTADQFAVVLEHIGSSREQARAQAYAMASDLQNSLTCVRLEQFSVDDIPVSFCIGITVFPFIESGAHADSSGRLIRRAMLALSYAKNHGVNQLQAYSEQLAEQAENFFQIEHDLRAALAGEQLRFYVQPQYDREGHVVNMEALVRWEHPEKGVISPGQFIPVAEASGLIVEIGHWMLKRACDLLNTPRMVQRGYGVSVNISARQFMQADFVETISSLLEQTKVQPQRLVLEVTESMLLSDVQLAIQTMQKLKVMGIQFALDDFGTGYSSLSYLRNLPIHELKIDQSFIRDLEPSGVSGALVQAMLMVAKQLRLRVVAEGVEQEDDAHLLQAWDPAILCQGYAFSKPMPVAQWLQRLESVPEQEPMGKFLD